MTNPCPSLVYILALLFYLPSKIANSFLLNPIQTKLSHEIRPHVHFPALFSSSSNSNETYPLSAATTRFPTSLDDQVRQATLAVKSASASGLHRHSIRLLLPLIGATELDDWPGGARQQMEAASPLVRTILMGLADSAGSVNLYESVIDESDGVRAIFAQVGENPVKDSCAVLLPGAETLNVIKDLDKQVGKERDLILVNVEWRNRNDFSFFGRGAQVDYVESYIPTYSCSSLMVEGNQVRVIRGHSGPWRVYLLIEPRTSDEKINWIEIGMKVFKSNKEGWEADGKVMLFDYGRPSYKEIEQMIVTREGYVPKTITERAMAAVSFIKDTL